MNLFSEFISQNQEIELPLLLAKKVRVSIKREDVFDEFVSGNKLRKLKYNLLAAKTKKCNTLLTFGGAYSNHIAAVAKAGKLLDFETIGVVRGDELADKIEENSTLRFAQSCGMKFEFVSRELYRQRNDTEYIDELQEKHPNTYIIPEGGTNKEAIKGCEEILTKKDEDFSHVAVAVGTGGTLAGIVNCSKLGQQVLGFPALKGNFLQTDISKFTKKQNWCLVPDYHFGGYAKIDESLIRFINQFKKDTKIALDPVYTGKMMFGIVNMIKNDQFKPGDSILTIHTGGLQGINGMNKLLRKKSMIEIK